MKIVQILILLVNTFVLFSQDISKELHNPKYAELGIKSVDRLEVNIFDESIVDTVFHVRKIYNEKGYLISDKFMNSNQVDRSYDYHYNKVHLLIGIDTLGYFQSHQRSGTVYYAYDSVHYEYSEKYIIVKGIKKISMTNELLLEDSTATKTYYTYNEEGLLIRRNVEYYQGSKMTNLFNTVYVYNENGLLSQMIYYNKNGLKPNREIYIYNE